jgi:hypothetical protein
MWSQRGLVRSDEKWTDVLSPPRPTYRICPYISKDVMTPACRYGLAILSFHGCLAQGALTDEFSGPCHSSYSYTDRGGDQTGRSAVLNTLLEAGLGNEVNGKFTHSSGNISPTPKNRALL